MNIDKVRTIGFVVLMIGFVALVTLVITQNPYPQRVELNSTLNPSSLEHANNGFIVKVLLIGVTICFIIGIFIWVYQKFRLNKDLAPFKKAVFSVGMSVVIIAIVLIILFYVWMFYKIPTIWR